MRVALQAVRAGSRPSGYYRQVRAPVLTLCLAAAVVAGCSRTVSAPAARPALVAGSARGRNVLLVTIDTLRRDRVGAYGHSGGLTPAIDALSAAGSRYANAFSHVPQTLPAHASILTGRTPVGHGVHVNGAASLPASVPTLATVLKGAGYRTGAFVGAFVLDARFGLARGFDVYDDRYPEDRRGASFAYAERRGGDVVQAAGDWIATPGAAGPWFAWVHLFDPHAPYAAPAEFSQRRAPYDGEVAYADAMLGRLLTRVGQAAGENATLVVLTADHGESLGEHGEATHGLFAYDATLAVPLVLSGAGVGAAVIEGATGHADILPTVADLLGLAVPAGVEGRSTLQPAAADRLIYFEALDAHLTRDWAPLSGMAGRAWKYVHAPVAELYDRAADPGERMNLAAANSERTAAMERGRLQAASAAPPDVPSVPIDAAAERRLRSLGYAATSAARAPATASRAYTAADDPKALVALNEQFNSALEAVSAGRPREALAALQSIVRARPDFATARTSAAALLMAEGHAAAAVTLLRQAPVATPDVLAKLGVALRESGDLSAAVTALEHARDAGYRNPELANDLGVAYARLGRVGDARAQFNALVAVDPNAADAWSNLGVLELGAHDTDAAARAFRAAVAVEPGRADAWEGLGAALAERDRPGAVAAWRRAERLAPQNYDLLFNLAMVLADGPTPQEARPYLERFLREAPRPRYRADLAQVAARLQAVGQ